MPDARRHITINGPFVMQHGTINSPQVAYETWGELNAGRDNAVLLFTGLSPSAHAASSQADPSAGWWEDVVGPHKPIDTTRFFVVCINSLGSCFGSTGPASVNPDTGELYRLDFPVLTLEDVARAGDAVVDELEIDGLHTVVGASMGGMTAIAYAMLFPRRTGGLVTISAGARSLPFSIALRSLQRELIRSDPIWRTGQYAHDESPVLGMRLARKLGMITYRSAREWAGRFGRERATDVGDPSDRFGIDFEVESYLEAHANKFIGTFDANCYLYLSRAMDLFDVADYGGTVVEGLKLIDVERAMIIGVETDILFPLSQQQELADGLSGRVDDLRFHALESIQGHDSFLVDMDRFRPVIAEFF